MGLDSTTVKLYMDDATLYRVLHNGDDISHKEAREIKVYSVGIGSREDESLYFDAIALFRSTTGPNGSKDSLQKLLQNLMGWIVLEELVELYVRQKLELYICSFFERAPKNKIPKLYKTHIRRKIDEIRSDLEYKGCDIVFVNKKHPKMDEQQRKESVGNFTSSIAFIMAERFDKMGISIDFDPEEPDVFTFGVGYFSDLKVEQIERLNQQLVEAKTVKVDISPRKTF